MQSLIPQTILVVAGAASFSTRDVWEGYRRGLASLGVDVVPYPTFSVLKILSHEQTGNDLVGKALDVRNRVNVALFIDGLYFQGDRSWVPATLRRHGVFTVLIKTDDPYTPIPLDTQAHFDLVVSNELGRLAAGEFYLPTATEAPPADLLVPKASEFDLCFIGTLFEDRVPLMRQIAIHCEKHGIRLALMGNLPEEFKELEAMAHVTVSRKPVAVDRKWKIYARSRAVLNLFRQSDSAVSPSPRIFEATAIGGPALLTGPRRSEVTSIFGESVYQYDDFDQFADQLDRLLSDDAGREAAVRQARQITLTGHLYQHRCQTLLTHVRGRLAHRCDVIVRDVDEPARSAEIDLDRRLAWIIGCGRTGSTWLCEMLGDIPHAAAWHEPYFGRMFKHVHEDPRERQRSSSFYADQDRGLYYAGLRQLFFAMAERRYGPLRSKSLFVKEVNTPELFETLGDCFPSAAVILLERDPFDVFDSYLAMMQPGSWNRRAGREWGNGPRQAARHIARSFSIARRAFDATPADRRLRLRYEDLLNDPLIGLQACCAITGLVADVDVLRTIVEERAFAREENVGPLSFRRFGQAGVWRESGHFTSEIQEIAHQELAEYRTGMGYC
jgi:hypothetical protein